MPHQWQGFSVITLNYGAYFIMDRLTVDPQWSNDHTLHRSRLTVPFLLSLFGELPPINLQSPTITTASIMLS